MTNNTADITGAITTLSNTLASMERRLADFTTQISAAKQRRREQLNRLVTTLLPDISNQTMARLKQEVPLFAVDHKILVTFEQNRKILWAFKPSGYDAALALLQAQLKLYLEQQGVVSTEDQSIQQLESDKAATASQQSEALEILQLMEKALHSAAFLPPEAIHGINTLAQRGRNLTGTDLNRASSKGGQFANGTVPSSSESDMDLWLWMVADIPTSFRTLILDSLSHHHDSNSSHLSATRLVPENGEFGGAGASSEFAPLNTSPAAQSLQIATDDRLGLFS